MPRRRVSRFDYSADNILARNDIIISKNDKAFDSVFGLDSYIQALPAGEGWKHWACFKCKMGFQDLTEHFFTYHDPTGPKLKPGQRFPNLYFCSVLPKLTSCHFDPMSQFLLSMVQEEKFVAANGQLVKREDHFFQAVAGPEPFLIACKKEFKVWDCLKCAKKINNISQHFLEYHALVFEAEASSSTCSSCSTCRPPSSTRSTRSSASVTSTSSTSTASTSKRPEDPKSYGPFGTNIDLGVF